MCACTAEQPRRLIVSNPFATLLCWISVSRFPWSVPMICSDRPTDRPNERTNQRTNERCVCYFIFLLIFIVNFLFVFVRVWCMCLHDDLMCIVVLHTNLTKISNENQKKKKTSKWRAREPTFYFPSYLVLLSLFNRSTNTHTQQHMHEHRHCGCRSRIAKDTHYT